MTLGKIDAFEKGQVHLLTGDEAQAVSRLEEIRQQALGHKDVPQIIRDIADLPTYQRREQALLNLFQRDPSMQKWYGLTDTREFASEALTNGELQSHLRGISAQAEAGARPRSLLHKVFDWVKRLVGIPDDSLHGRALENVATLMGGRRVMEGDFQTGGLDGMSTMMQKENLLAKRYLDHRAELEGYLHTAEVPIDQLNGWLSEYREGQGMSSRTDPYSARTIAPPDTTAHASPEAMAHMTDGRDIIDHLAQTNGISNRDGDSLRILADRAYRDKALTDHQYISAHQAIDGVDHYTLNKIMVQAGEKEDRKSIRGQLFRAWKNTVTPEGMLPKEFHEELLSHGKFAQNELATRARRGMDEFDKAVARNYKGGQLTAKVREDMTRVLQGDPAPPSMPVDVVNALKGMRGDIDNLSAHMVTNNMLGEEKEGKVIDNIGKYTHRSYQIFEDERWARREASTQHRAQAEKELNTILGKRAKAQLVKANAVNAGFEAARVFKPGSTEWNDAYDNAYRAAEVKTAANPASAWLDRKISQWEQVAHNKETGNLQYGHAFALNDSIMKELSPILEKSPATRALIGEQRDTKALYARTLWRQSAFIHSVEMSRRSAVLGRENGWLSSQWTRTNTAQIPAQFAHLGEIAGKWTTPDIADALTDYTQTLRSADEGLVGGSLRAMEGKARYMTTIGSLMRGAGNFWSGIFSHLNNGYFNPFDGEANTNAWKVVQGQLFRRSTPEINAFMDQMHRYGLSDKSGNISLLMDYLSKGPQIMSRDPLDSLEAFQQWATKLGQNKLGQRVGEAAIDFHTLGNFMSKASQWVREQDRQRQINDWDVKNRGVTALTDEQVKAKAAQIVREQNISYSLATKSIQMMRKNPTVGTFLTFWGESLRSYGHSAVMALNYLKSENPVKRQIGVARLGGLITSMAIPAALQGASQAMYGVSAKEDQNFRSLLPPWEQHNTFFYGPEVNGRRTYTNLDYILPQGDVARAINALFMPHPDGIIGQATSSAHELFAPVFNVGLIPGAMIDVLRNQTEYGTQVYNPEDHWINKVDDVAQHVFQRGAGGTVGRLFTKIIPGITTEGGKVSPGGAVYDWGSAVLPEFSGLNVKEISYPDRFRSDMYSTKDSIKHAQQLFTGPIQRSGNELTDDQIRSLYQRSEDARQRVFHSLVQKIDAVRFGGMSTREIKSALKERQFSNQEIDDLMTGRYHPYIPSANVLKNARLNGNFIPPRMFSTHAVPEEEE